MAEPDAPELFDRERAQELHEKLLADLAERVNELETLLGRHDAFSVLSQLALLEFWHDPETFKEYEHAGLSAHVEYVAQLLLKSPYAHGSDAELLVGNSVERIRDLVTDIFRMSFWLRLREAELSGNNLDPADHLRHRTITQEMHFRSPGYLCHLRPVLLGLFEPFDAWLLQHLGFTAEDAVTVADGITHMLNRRVMERTHEAVEFSEKLLADLDRHRRGETCTDDDGYRAVVERFVGLEDEAAVAHSRMIASSWFMFGLSAAMEFDARLVSEETGIAEHRVAACLDYFAQGFGSERPEFYRPEPLHRLRVRPLLKHGGTYLSPCNGLFMWAIQPRLEEALKPRWEAYQRARARFLEQESVRVLSAALGDAAACTTSLMMAPAVPTSMSMG